MSEDEKIKMIVRKYQEYLKNNDVDVAQSEKGVWFFFVYDPTAESYYRFFRFKTAHELEQGIIETVADELSSLLEVSVESSFHNMDNIDLKERYDGSCNKALARLVRDIKILRGECQKVMSRLEGILGSLPEAFL